MMGGPRGDRPSLWVDCSQCSYEDLGSDEEEEEMKGALSPPISGL